MKLKANRAYSLDLASLNWDIFFDASVSMATIYNHKILWKLFFCSFLFILAARVCIHYVHAENPTLNVIASTTIRFIGIQMWLRKMTQFNLDFHMSKFTRLINEHVNTPINERWAKGIEITPMILQSKVSSMLHMSMWVRVGKFTFKSYELMLVFGSLLGVAEYAEIFQHFGISMGTFYSAHSKRAL